jgi:hypothetical protein
MRTRALLVLIVLSAAPAAAVADVIIPGKPYTPHPRPHPNPGPKQPTDPFEDTPASSVPASAPVSSAAPPPVAPPVSAPVSAPARAPKPESSGCQVSLADQKTQLWVLTFVGLALSATLAVRVVGKSKAKAERS